MPQIDHNRSPASIIAEFCKAMKDAGITPPENIIADGKIHNFSTEEGNSSDDAGRYILHLDGFPAGWFRDHREGIEQKWHLNTARALTDQEQAAHQAQIAKIRQKRDIDDALRKEVAKAKSVNIWKAAAPAEADHPYLVRKQVAPSNALREILAEDAERVLGYMPKSKGEQLQGRLIVVPVKVGQSISTLELIDENGRKSAVAGGAKARGYWAPDPLPEGDGEGLVLGIGEGVATVLSVYYAAAIAVVAGLSSGNLLAVGQVMRALYPKARLIFLGDLGNGLAKAEQAARAVGGELAIPSFTPERVDGDFNDMLVAHGADAIKQAVANAKPPSDEPPPEGFLDVSAHVSMTPTVELIRAADLTPERVEWHWDGWLAASKLHILGGAPGTGKTTLALSIAAAVSTGGRWPDGTRAPAGNVVIWSGEDGPADTLVPRLMLQGANLDRVFFVSDVRHGDMRRAFDPAVDMQALKEIMQKIGDVRLLVIDPVVSAVAGDSHKNTEVRRSLQPIVDLAAKTNCAVLGITHFSKGTSGRDPVERLTGSLAFGALARVVWVAAKREDDDQALGVRLLLRAKSNIGPDTGGFEYVLHEADLPQHPGIRASGVKWGAQLNGSARELLSAAETSYEDSDGGSLSEAKQFLRDLLSEGPVATKMIKAEADGAGHSWMSIRHAKTALGVDVRKSGMEGPWVWALTS
jgi:putative DNA primase/helicase